MRKVRFDNVPVIFLIKENECHKKARESYWIQVSADRHRFMDRVKRVEEILVPVLRHGKNSQ